MHSLVEAVEKARKKSARGIKSTLTGHQHEEMNPNDNDDTQQSPLLIRKHDLDGQESETAAFDAIDQRTISRQMGDRGALDDMLARGGANDDDRAHVRPERRPTLKDIALRVRKLQEHESSSSPQQRHFRGNSSIKAVSLLAQISRSNVQHLETLANSKDASERNLYRSVRASDHDEDDDDDDDMEEERTVDDDESQEMERLPLRQDATHYGSVLPDAPLPPSNANNKKNLWIPLSTKLCRKIKTWMTVANLTTWLLQTVLHSYFCTVALPLFAAALVLYYGLGNPKLDFMPGEVTLSWWCNFIGRHIICLELARILQFVLIDVLVLGTRFALRLFGPLLTLICLQARGGPVLSVIYAIAALCLMHGDNDFQRHWLYWTGLSIYKHANSGAGIIQSELYLRALVCVLVAGTATALKRVAIVIRFGRRQFSEFKPRLEKILGEVVLLSEISSLAAQASDLDDTTHSGISADDLDMEKIKEQPSTGLAAVQWESVQFHNVSGGGGASSIRDPSNRESDQVSEGTAEDDGKIGKSSSPCRHRLSKTRSGNLRIKDLLDRWEEPVNKLEKSTDSITISDVLRFKRALTFMDDANPFGEDYGPARSRDECIQSSTNVYYNLLRLAESKVELPFEILELLTIEEDGTVDDLKLRALQKLFRPDLDNTLSLLTFVQCCDNVYKRLRYFRASVGNSSVIDRVLEDVANVFFVFVLTLILLSLMNYNPWTLLVSVTSLLVSISFALGPSVSKYVEGVLLIAVRRPYDLGDRIFLTSAENVAAGDSSGSTWFVEDINLTATTLRYARTNEVCTVNNWSIAGSRIINCNRSPNAIVYLEVQLHISILEGDALKSFRAKLEAYVTNNPRTWESLAFCRHENIDADNEIVYFVMAFRHRNSWQDASRIKLNRAELLRYMWELGDNMGVNLETPPARRLLYYGGVLEHGQVEDYKKNLLNPKNIRSHHKREDAHSSAPPTMRASLSQNFEQTFHDKELDPHGGVLQGE